MQSPKWAELEKEFGCSAKLLVIRWRQNSTYRTIASAVGISKRQLRRWMRYWGIEPDGQKRDEFSQPIHTCDKRARELGFDDAADAIRHYKLPPHRWADWQIAELLECSEPTIWRHKPNDIKGTVCISDRGREKLRECGRKAGGRIPDPDHPWRYQDD